MDFEEWIEIELNSSTSVTTYCLWSAFFLSLDVILPVPSSLIMIVNGKVCGFIPGALLTLTSGLISSYLGYFLGLKSSPTMNKIIRETEQKTGISMMNKYGYLAITVSKAIPIISEATSFVCGTAKVPIKEFILYSAVGYMVIGLAYGFIGSTIGTKESTMVGTIVILSVLIAGWILNVSLQRPLKKNN
jgi:uncharacterized membrane protein YdjX (TVP38/TMEM64 family)